MTAKELEDYIRDAIREARITGLDSETYAAALGRKWGELLKNLPEERRESVSFVLEFFTSGFVQLRDADDKHPFVLSRYAFPVLLHLAVLEGEAFEELVKKLRHLHQQSLNEQRAMLDNFLSSLWKKRVEDVFSKIEAAEAEYRKYKRGRS